MSATQPHRAQFPGTIDGAVTASSWLHGVAEREALPGKLVFALEVCLEELFTNVVRHGGRGRDAAPLSVDVGLSVEGNDVAMYIEDNGKSFDVSQAPARPIRRPLEEVMPGGLGMQLIRSFSKELLYESRPDGNRVILKFLRQEQAGSTAGA
ncbi:MULTISPECIES: ATP-binding protein [unclassified Devosia]|jgi:serine/threonine-protein kinase RsbW|uniref:ATP-binding protein n=1 Tax=unclassified Devosia TaxID=196773 RepID=UPI00086E9DC8|nr:MULTISPECIES: ATP-binding protein [unclassified Devosia]MBN9360160.1 ATP-binding protein [Devosia sp.]ODS86464.1 MAG: hypothetical protein ABS47_14150 [Devosia sp. SCN 66-27]OJX22203.1 MAG: hypothetical protein BGO83_15235 [Devosia sp. 66-14]